MLPSYFDYIHVHLRQKVRLRPDLSPKFLLTLGPNPARTRPEKPRPTYSSDDNHVSRHNNVMQFLDVSKNCQVTWLESSTCWKQKLV